jgi:hypothetical protein
MYKVYDKSGNIRCETTTVEFNGTWKSVGKLTATIYSPVPIEFANGDYITYRDVKYTLRYLPSVKKQATKLSYGQAFVYDNMIFYAASDDLTRCMFLDIVPSDNKIHYTELPNFSFYCTKANDFAERLQANLDRLYTGDSKFTVTVATECPTIKAQSLSFSNVSCWDALAQTCTTLKIDFITRDRLIKIGGKGDTVPYQFVYQSGLTDVTRTANENNAIITRLRAYGNTRNLPYRYYNNRSLYPAVGNGIPDGMYLPNLMLPGLRETSTGYNNRPVGHDDIWEAWDGLGDVYIEKTDSETEYGINEGTVFFNGENTDLDDIYPSLEGMTQAQLVEAGVPCTLDSGDNGNLDEIKSAKALPDDGVLPAEDSETKLEPYFYISIKDIGFDINNYKTTETVSIEMKTGACAGRAFEVVTCDKNGNAYDLKCKRTDDESVMMAYPNTTFTIAAGDKFVITGITLPEAYIKAAEIRLRDAACVYLLDNCKTKFTYTPNIDNIFIERNPTLRNYFYEGNVISIYDADLDISVSVTISNVTIKEGDKYEPQYSITLSDEVEGTMAERVASVSDKVNQIEQSIGGDSVDLIKRNDYTQPTDYNAYSSLRSRTEFISKIDDDTAQGKIAFKKGASFGSYATGLTGYGGNVDEGGNGELESLSLRRWLEVPELRFNRVDTISGELWNAPGFGTIKTVTIGEAGNSGTIELKLEDDEYATIAAGDICRGSYINTGGASSTSNDECGFNKMKGFLTSYFKVDSVTTNTKGSCVFNFTSATFTSGDSVYLSPNPCEMMKFAVYGSFTDTTRQASAYHTRTYTRYLRGVNTWIITAANIAAQEGLLDGLTITKSDGSVYNLGGYGAYYNDNIYIKGGFMQLTDESKNDLKQEIGNYSAWLSSYAKSINVDENGRIVGGLVTDGIYFLNTAVFAMKADSYLTLADTAASGKYTVSLQCDGCLASLINGQVCITSITGLSAGDAPARDLTVADAVKKCTVCVSIDCEGVAAFKFNYVITCLHPKNGAKGDKGRMARPRGEWVSTVEYVYDDDYIDIVYHNSTWWACSATCTGVEPTSANSGYWQVASQYEFVATKVLLAESGYIKYMGSNYQETYNKAGQKVSSWNAEGDGEIIQYYPESGRKRMYFGAGVWYYYNDDATNSVAWSLGSDGNISTSSTDDWRKMILAPWSAGCTQTGDALTDGVTYKVFEAGGQSPYRKYAGLTVSSTVDDSTAPNAVAATSYIADGEYTSNVAVSGITLSQTDTTITKEYARAKFTYSGGYCIATEQVYYDITTNK